MLNWKKVAKAMEMTQLAWDEYVVSHETVSGL